MVSPPAKKLMWGAPCAPDLVREAHPILISVLQRQALLCNARVAKKWRFLS